MTLKNLKSEATEHPMTHGNHAQVQHCIKNSWVLIIVDCDGETEWESALRQLAPGKMFLVIGQKTYMPSLCMLSDPRLTPFSLPI